MTKRGLGLGLFVGAALFASQAMAATSLDVCDALGLSGLTISSDTNCLQITGEVKYEFVWGDAKCKTADEGCGDKTRELVLGDLLRFSNFRVNLDPGYIFTAPDALPLLESGTPAAAPAYTLPVSYSGFKFGAGLDTRLNVDGFAPMDLGLDIEYGQLTGRGSSGSQAFPQGLGAQSVGLVFGAFPGNTTVNTTDVLIERTFLNFDKQLHVPFAGGQTEMFGYPETWTSYVIGGARFGGLNETQRTRIATSNGTLNYDATLNGGFAGAYLGLGIDKTLWMPDKDSAIGAHAGITAGLDMHRYRVTDSVSGTFGGIASSTNTYEVSGWIPTIELMGGLSFLKGGWSAGIEGGVAAGKYPALDLIRPISNLPSTPYLQPRSIFSGELRAHVNFAF